MSHDRKRQRMVNAAWGFPSTQAQHNSVTSRAQGGLEPNQSHRQGSSEPLKLNQLLADYAYSPIDQKTGTRQLVESIGLYADWPRRYPGIPG